MLRFVKMLLEISAPAAGFRREKTCGFAAFPHFQHGCGKLFPISKTFKHGCGKTSKTPVLPVYIPQNGRFSPFPHNMSLFWFCFFSTACGKPHWITEGQLVFPPESAAFSTQLFNRQGKTTRLTCNSGCRFPHRAVLGNMYYPPPYIRSFFLPDILEFSCNSDVFVLYYTQYV